MSIKLMSQVYERDLPAHLQRVLLVLADHADDSGGRCYPSVPLIAWKLGLKSRQAVMRTISELEELGALSVIRTTGKVNRYQINLDALAAKPPFHEEDEDTRVLDDTRQSDTPVYSGTETRVLDGTPPVYPSTPEPPVTTKEPSFSLDDEIDGGRTPILDSLMEEGAPQERVIQWPKERTTPPGPAPAPATTNRMDTARKFQRAYPSRRSSISPRDLVNLWNQTDPADEKLIFSRLEHWKLSDEWQEDDGKYIPGIKKFLEEERWRSVPEEKPTSSGVFNWADYGMA